MIAILKGFDTFLDAACTSRSVRWLLVIIIITLIVVAGFCMARQKVLSLQLAAAKGQTAMYVSALKMQNESILKAGEDKKAQDAAIAAATRKADKYKREADKWREDALNTPLSGTCDEMVDQAIGALK